MSRKLILLSFIFFLILGIAPIDSYANVSNVKLEPGQYVNVIDIDIPALKTNREDFVITIVNEGKEKMEYGLFFDGDYWPRKARLKGTVKAGEMVMRMKRIEAVGRYTLAIACESKGKPDCKGYGSIQIEQ